MALCPKCDRTIRQVKAEAVTIDGGPAHRWAGSACVCPNCSAILGVSIDPMALKSDLEDQLAEIRKLLERR